MRPPKNEELLLWAKLGGKNGAALSLRRAESCAEVLAVFERRTRPERERERRVDRWKKSMKWRREREARGGGGEGGGQGDGGDLLPAHKQMAESWTRASSVLRRVVLKRSNGVPEHFFVPGV